MNKKIFTILVVAALLIGLFAGCAQNGEQAAGTGETTKDTSGQATEKSTESQEPVEIKFYGSDAEYNQNIVAGFEETHPGITVEIVPIDFGNAEQIIKTGIASGDPVDVSFFWGTAISTFVDADMALDLTPYLEENNGEWKNTFVESYLDGSKINGKYYAIPYQPVLENMFYNKALFKQYDREIPMTWDEFIEFAEELKKDGIYATAIQNDYHHQMLNFAYQYMLDAGLNMDDVAAGKVSFVDNPGFKECLTMIKNLYENNYWYPGEGALTTSSDEVKAAFYQGKVATIYGASALIKELSDGAEFEVGAMTHPLINEDGIPCVNVLTNALFIPYNAHNAEEGIAFMKYYTSPDGGLKETVATWRPPSVKNMDVSIPQLKEIQKLTEGEVFSYKQINQLSPEMNSYIGKELVSSVCTGVSVDEAVQKLEDMRIEAQND